MGFPMALKLIVFDLDGTLADTEADLADAVNELRTRLGFKAIPRRQVRSGVGRGVKFLLKRKIPPISAAARAAHPDLYREFQKIYARRCAQTTRLFSGTKAMLDMMPRGSVLAVATNKLGYLSRKILRRLGILGRFRAVVGGDEMRRHKPHPAVLLDLMKRFRASPLETVLIGDSRFDMECGSRARVKLVGCLWGFGSRRELTPWKPDAIAARPSALPALLARLDRLPQGR